MNDLVKEGILLDRGVQFSNYGFGYNGKGNALSMMGSALSYNPINLPKVISTSTGEERIWYTINGEKFKIMTDTEVTEDEVTTTETKTRYLVQGFELADGGAVHSFNFGDGRVLMPGGEDTLAAPRVQFHLKDHLGNVMVVFEDKDDDNEIDIEDTEEPNEIIERFMYYAFGMQWEGAWMYDEPIGTEENRYRYNSKEYSKGSRLSDYGARYYSSDIGRWNAVDPLADQAPDWTPYRYGFNNPISFIDPDGLFEDEASAKRYAKDHNIKIRPKSFIGMLFTSGGRSNIIENSDGTFSINNRRDKTSISDLGGDLGVMTAALITPNDIMSVEKEGNIVFGYTETATRRDGSEMDVTPIAGTVPDVGPGKIVKGYKYLKTIKDKYDVFQKTKKAENLTGQSRAVWNKVFNRQGKEVRKYKDAYKPDGRHHERAHYKPHQYRSRKSTD